MSLVKILTDSTCDLSQEIINSRNIHVIPLKVCFKEEVYLDRIDITTPDLYKKYKEKGFLPTTAAATILEFVELFKELTSDGSEVVYTGIGSHLSSTFQNAVIARSELDDEVAKRVHLVDSANLSTGIGLVVLKMCDLRDQGLSGAQIQEEAEKIVPCVRAQFAVKELEFLHKGGRCSGTVKFFGTLLRIRLILRIFQGKIVVSDKLMTRRFEKALDYQINDILSNIDNVDTDYLFVTHSEGDEEANYVLEHLPEEVKSRFKNIYVTKAGCVISTHCGQGTLGILYIKKEPLVDDK